MKKVISLLLTLCLLAACGLAGAENPGLGGKPWINSNVYGNWPSEHPGPEISFDLYVNYDKYQELPAQNSQPVILGALDTQTQIYAQLESLCRDPEKTGTEDECLRILYNLYMDTEKRAQEGFEPLRTHAGRLRAVKTLDELTALIREEGWLYGNALYEPAISTQPRSDSSDYSVQLNIIPLIDDLPLDEETFESPGKDMDGTREKLLRMGFAEEEIPQLIEGILAYDTIVDDCYAETELENDLVGRTDQMASLEEIREVCPPAWEMIRAQGLVKEGMETELLYRFALGDMFRIRNLYTEENLETVKAMLALGMYKNAEQIFPQETESGITPDFLSFIAITPMVVREQAFVHNFVPQERIDIYKQLVDEYKGAMRTRIGQNSRLSEESRKEALTKIDNLIGSEILYPYGEIDCGSLLEGLRSCENLLEANGQCSQLQRKELMHYAGREIVRGNRYCSNNGALMEEGQYYPSENVFYIGAGALVGEMADFTSRETVLGTLGFHLAHELSHGFDTLGSKYDAFGEMFGEGTSGYLYTEEDLKNYLETAKTIAGQISQVDMWDGNNLNGEQMIGEVMADLTSVTLAMDLAKQAEHFDYDAYFRAFASAWYAVYYSRDAMLGHHSVEVHPPHYFRINFTLPHFDEFYQTYPSVTEGTPMYIAPEDRILPW